MWLNQTAQESLDEWQKFVARFPTWQDYERVREEERRAARRERALARQRAWKRTLVRAVFVDPEPDEHAFAIHRLHQTGWHIEGREKRRAV